MLTLPDIKAKQVLFIQTEHGVKNRLFFRNENLVFEKDGKIINQASCHRLFAVFIAGDFSFTSGLIRECRKRAVSLFFMNEYNLKTYSFFSAKADGNYLLRKAQYTMSGQKELAIAKSIVRNKIKNQINLMQSVDEGEAQNEDYGEKVFAAVKTAKNANELLGLEGNFSKIFFSRYFKDLGWYRRMPRVKPDVVNFLLDMGYTFLFNFIDSFLLLFGFDTFKGCYHKLFFQRKSLSCDVVESFRCIVERQILKSYHLKQINEKDFFVEQGRYALSYEKSQKYAKIFLETIMDNRENMYLYAQEFYRHIMNGKNDFPEFNILTK